MKVNSRFMRPLCDPFRLIFIDFIKLALQVGKLNAISTKKRLTPIKLKGLLATRESFKMRRLESASEEHTLST